MNYTGYENHNVDELVRQIEHEGASRATAELIKRIADLQEEAKGQQNRIDELESDVSVLEEERDELKTKYESLNELLEGEPA